MRPSAERSIRPQDFLSIVLTTMKLKNQVILPLVPRQSRQRKPPAAVAPQGRRGQAQELSVENVG